MLGAQRSYLRWRQQMADAIARARTPLEKDPDDPTAHRILEAVDHSMTLSAAFLFGSGGSSSGGTSDSVHRKIDFVCGENVTSGPKSAFSGPSRTEKPLLFRNANETELDYCQPGLYKSSVRYVLTFLRYLNGLGKQMRGWFLMLN